MKINEQSKQDRKTEKFRKIIENLAGFSASAVECEPGAHEVDCATCFNEEVHGWIELFSFCFNKSIKKLDEDFVECLECYPWKSGSWTLPDVLKWVVSSAYGNILKKQMLPWTFLDELDAFFAHKREKMAPSSSESGGQTQRPYLSLVELTLQSNRGNGMHLLENSNLPH